MVAKSLLLAGGFVLILLVPTTTGEATPTEPVDKSLWGLGFWGLTVLILVLCLFFAFACTLGAFVLYRRHIRLQHEKEALVAAQSKMDSAVDNPLQNQDKGKGDKEDADGKPEQPKQLQLSEYDWMTDLSASQLDTQMRKQERSNPENRTSLSAFERGDLAPPTKSATFDDEVGVFKLSSSQHLKDPTAKAPTNPTRTAEVREIGGGRRRSVMDQLNDTKDLLAKEVSSAIADVTVVIPYKIKVSKRILIAVNLIFFVLGLVLIIGTAAVAANGQWSVFFKKSFTDMMFISASFIMLVSILGLVGSWYDSKKLLCPYVFAVFVILLMQIYQS